MLNIQLHFTENLVTVGYLYSNNHKMYGIHIPGKTASAFVDLNLKHQRISMNIKKLLSKTN